MTIPFIIIRNSEPICPIIIESKPTMIAMPHNIKVIIHAQLDSLHSLIYNSKIRQPNYEEVPTSIVPNIGIKSKTVSPMLLPLKRSLYLQ